MGGGEEAMSIHQDDEKWKYACQNCGTPYTSKPEFCYDCGCSTVLPLELD